MKKKKFDSVKMMREIREKPHEAYQKNPEQKQQELEKIRERYKHLIKKSKAA